MKQEPCQKLRKELLQAIKDWEKTARDAKAFVLYSPNGEIKYTKPEYYKRMRASLEREKNAREKYFHAFEALQKCEVENLVNDSWFDKTKN